MGIYIFDKEVLTQALLADAEDPDSSHDFGKDIIPKLVGNNSVYAYKFGDEEGRVTQDAYWRDVGTIDSYYQSNMDLLKPASLLIYTNRIGQFAPMIHNCHQHEPSLR